MSSAGGSVCPLCQAPVDSQDELQLHYLTSCAGYDKGMRHYVPLVILVASTAGPIQLCMQKVWPVK